MTSPNDSSEPKADDIQFDEAEFVAGAPEGPVCSGCKSPITGTYYAAQGNLFCEPCRNRIESQLRGGSRFGRFAKALVLGSIAAIVGGLVYYGITETTGLNIGLVSVVVGVMIGGAVKSGSGNRGGWLYQLLAVLLTYTAIAGMIVPDLVSAIKQTREEEAKQAQEEIKKFIDAAKSAEAEAEKAGVPAVAKNDAGRKAPTPETDAAAKAKPIPDKDHPARAESEVAREAQRKSPAVAVEPAAKQPAKPEGLDQAAEKPADLAARDEADENDADGDGLVVEVADEAPPGPGALLVGLFVLVGVAYSLPVFAAIQSPISGLIYGFAIWEAWKINKKVELGFQGPYVIEARANDEPATQDASHDA